jgi:hypothetical protein
VWLALNQREVSRICIEAKPFRTNPANNKPAELLCLKGEPDRDSSQVYPKLGMGLFSSFSFTSVID